MLPRLLATWSLTFAAARGHLRRGASYAGTNSTALPVDEGGLEQQRQRAAMIPAIDATRGEIANVRERELQGGGCTFKKEPYLMYPGRNDEMTILWQLEVSCESRTEVTWGPFGGGDGSGSTTEIVTDADGSNFQRITLSGLTPGAKYEYSVIAPSGRELSGSFHAAPPAASAKVKFLALGDTRSSPRNFNDVTRGMVNSYRGDSGFQTMCVHTGDWVHDGDDDDAWTKEFFRISSDTTSLREFMRHVPFMGARGNHEERGIFYKKYFPYPYTDPNNRDFRWSFDYGPLHVAVFDLYKPDGSSDKGLTRSSPQALWLENDLKNSNKPWKAVVLHEPGWCAGPKANNKVVQKVVHPIANENGVDILFAGHTHNYVMVKVDNVVHVDTSGGGAPLRDTQPGYPLVLDKDRKEGFHFCEVEIDDEKNVLEVTARTPNGAVLHNFSINRGGGTATPTATPTARPTQNPTAGPTATPPTASPTGDPTTGPTGNPTTANPTATPTENPTAGPTATPIPASPPTASPTGNPTIGPTANPTASATSNPTAMPTANPTAGPTESPTPSALRRPAPTATPTGSPPVEQALVLRPSNCKDKDGARCNQCEGDCGKDAHCAPGLRCFHRRNGNKDEKVPGCKSGGVDDQPWKDYCYDPNHAERPNTTSPPTSEPTESQVERRPLVLRPGKCRDRDGERCDRCEGDCGNDAHCVAGLACFHRRDGNRDEKVPGCKSGGSGDQLWKDYCYDPNSGGPPTVLPPTAKPTTATPTGSPVEKPLVLRGCTVKKRCDKCEGDCGNDGHCLAGLTCFHRKERNSEEKVPGCKSGGSGDQPYKDYCI